MRAETWTRQNEVALIDGYRTPAQVRAYLRGLQARTVGFDGAPMRPSVRAWLRGVALSRLERLTAEFSLAWPGSSSSD